MAIKLVNNRIVLVDGETNFQRFMDHVRARNQSLVAGGCQKKPDVVNVRTQIAAARDILCVRVLSARIHHSVCIIYIRVE